MHDYPVVIDLTQPMRKILLDRVGTGRVATAMYNTTDFGYISTYLTDMSEDEWEVIEMAVADRLREYDQPMFILGLAEEEVLADAIEGSTIFEPPKKDAMALVMRVAKACQREIAIPRMWNFVNTHNDKGVWVSK